MAAAPGLTSGCWYWAATASLLTSSRRTLPVRSCAAVHSPPTLFFSRSPCGTRSSFGAPHPCLCHHCRRAAHYGLPLNAHDPLPPLSFLLRVAQVLSCRLLAPGRGSPSQLGRGTSGEGRCLAFVDVSPLSSLVIIAPREGGQGRIFGNICPRENLALYPLANSGTSGNASWHFITQLG